MAVFFAAGSFTMFHTEYAPGRRMAPHRDRTPRISIVTRGEVRETTAGRDEFATSGSVVLKPEGVTHANVLGPEGADLLSVVLPPWADGAGWHDWRWFHGGSPSAAATRVVSTLRSRTASPADLDDAVYDLLACVGPPEEPSVVNAVPGWLDRVRERLSDEFAAPCSVEAVAADAGVHPVHLTRLFRRHYACSVTGYVRRLRVRAAANALASTPLRLAELALHAGFSDQSHMCRIFKADMGVTPGRYRSIMRSRQV